MKEKRNIVGIENIPNEMKEYPVWICWKKEKRNNGKIAKIPMNPYDGRYGDVTNPAKWTTFEKAVEACKKYNMDGIGFVFSKDYGFVGIDIDQCIDEEGILSDFAKDIIEELDSYTELSPSGTGIHIYCFGKLPEGKRRDSKLGIEMYDSERFFTVTGNTGVGRKELRDKGVFERTKELEMVYERYLQGVNRFEESKKDLFGRREDERLEVGSYNTSRYFEGNDLNEEEIINRAIRSKNGMKFQDLYNGEWKQYYQSQSDADQAFCNMLAFWTARDAEKIDIIFRRSELFREKWDRRHFGNGKTYGQATIEKAIVSCGNIYEVRSGFEGIRDNEVSRSKVKGSQENTPCYSKLDTLPIWYSQSNGKVTFLPGLLAKHMAENVPAIYVGGKFYLYKNGVYSELSVEGAMRMVQEHLIDQYSKSSHVKDAFELWKNKIYKAPEELNEESKNHIINFKNGLFDIRNREFIEHNPEHLTTVQLNCNYNPDANCDNFMKFMREVLPEDCIELAQELVGYLLVPFTSAQKAFVLYGPPRTGKSTFLRVVESIIGRENISNVPWQELDSRFKTALLYGKMVNIFADLPNKSIKDAGVFKALTGEDMLVGEHKFGTPFSFKNKARLIFSCNELPKNYADKTDAFYRRLIILPFNKQVGANEIDTRLSEKLANEKDGIIQWALQGLYRLMENDFRFTENEETKNIIDNYKTESDSVLWFIKNCCEINEGSSVGSVELYNSYKKSCVDGGMGAVSQIKFNKTIEASFSNIIIKTKDVATRRAMFKGIGLIN